MNPIQSKIEQTAKEYLSYKAIVDKEIISAKKDKEKIAKEVEGLTQKEIFTKYFERFGFLELLTQDMLKIKARLYNEIDLVRDLIEIPKEIMDLVEDYRPIYIYAIIGDEIKLIEEEIYNQRKQDYIFTAEQLTKLNPLKS